MLSSPPHLFHENGNELCFDTTWTNDFFEYFIAVKQEGQNNNDLYAKSRTAETIISKDAKIKSPNTDPYWNLNSAKRVAALARRNGENTNEPFFFMVSKLLLYICLFWQTIRWTDQPLWLQLAVHLQLDQHETAREMLHHPRSISRAHPNFNTKMSKALIDW